MKKIVLVSYLVASTLFICSQTQLPNSSFEDIQNVVGTDPDENPINYDSLGMGWTSGNAIKRHIPGIETQFMKDTSYAHAGDHAILLRTDSIGPVVAVGNAGLGLFIYNETNPFNSIIFGAPFADRPSSFSGWYTYKSVAGVSPGDGDESLIDGDSLLISCFLTKWNSVEAKRDTIAFSSWTSSETVEEYTEFSIPFNYFSAEIPDSANVIFLSSSLGYVIDPSDRPYGIKGSTLIVDDLQMNYEPASLEELIFNVDVYAVNKTLTIVMDEFTSGTEVKVCDMAGRTLTRRKITENTTSFNVDYTGVVFVVINSALGNTSKKVFIH